jgi:hypothetical protein
MSSTYLKKQNTLWQVTGNEQIPSVFLLQRGFSCEIGLYFIRVIGGICKICGFNFPGSAVTDSAKMFGFGTEFREGLNMADDTTCTTPRYA